MLVFRSFAIGLLAGCFLLIATRPSVELLIRHTAAPAQLAARRGEIAGDVSGGARGAPATEPRAASIIDVAPGVDFATLAGLIRLAPDERIASVDRVPVSGDLEAGVALAAHPLDGGRFIDLEVVGPRGARRVLVLLHRAFARS